MQTSLIGQAIRHSSFGKGIVTDLTDHRITVCFSRGDKNFIYPDAFASFLTLKDPRAQKKINCLLDEKRQVEEAKKRAHHDKQIRKNRLRNLRITRKSQAVFDIPNDWPAASPLPRVLSTGHYLNGPSKGKIRIPRKLKPNSVCLLTQLAKGEKERNRRIVGAFMVQADFFGDLCRSGQIESHDHYKLALPEDHSLLLWNYFSEADWPKRWGNTPYKIVSNINMQPILADMRDLLAPTDSQEIADQFYRYFCKMNHLQDQACDPATLDAAPSNCESS